MTTKQHKELIQIILFTGLMISPWLLGWIFLGFLLFLYSFSKPKE